MKLYRAADIEACNSTEHVKVGENNAEEKNAL